MSAHMTKPSPCGWCGETPTLCDWDRFQFSCDDCGTAGPRCDSEDAACNAWDRLTYQAEARS